VLLLCIGFAGASIGAFYGVAQSVRTLKVRSTAGISRLGWVMSTTAAGLWMMYGALERSGPQLLANTPWFASCLIIGLFMARERVMPSIVGYGLPWVMLGVGLALLTAQGSALAVIGPLIRGNDRATDGCCAAGGERRRRVRPSLGYFGVVRGSVGDLRGWDQGHPCGCEQRDCNRAQRAGVALPAAGAAAHGQIQHRL
jgi:uncharacterized protein with PQ loop repeat